jgi:bifunctional pyridoxal-dependent enzyme with beta-cystathionase and maltose regulon repressor activities
MVFHFVTWLSHYYSPHNPTGKVFSKEELLIISQACQKMDCFAVTDEVNLRDDLDRNSLRYIQVFNTPSVYQYKMF